MKKITLTLLLVSTVAYLSAQWQSNGNDIYYNSGHVGIGESYPEYLLDIFGDADLWNPTNRQFINLTNINNTTHSNVAILFNSGTGGNRARGSFGVCANSYIANPGVSGFTYLQGFNSGIMLRAISQTGKIKFTTGGTSLLNERMVIDSSGNVGIGTDKPCSKLQVSGGDIFIEEINTGIIMTSPNGSYWRVTIDDDGSLITSQIDSPCDITTSNNKIETQDIEVSIFPNPVKRHLNIEIDKTNLDNLSVIVSNIFGEEVLCTTIHSGTNEIDITNLSSGAYLMTLLDNSNNTLKSMKFIKE